MCIVYVYVIFLNDSVNSIQFIKPICAYDIMWMFSETDFVL